MDAARQKIIDQVAQGLLTQAQADKMLAALEAVPPMPASRGATRPTGGVARDVVTCTLEESPLVSLTNAAGDVHLTHTSAAATVRVEREAAADDDDAARRMLDTVRVDCIDGAVHVAAGEAGARALLVVALPEIDALQIEGERVSIDGVGADIRCIAGAGAEVRHLGGLVDLRVENGDAVVSDVQGRVVVHLANGSLQVVGSGGHLEAVCLNGDVTVEGFAGDVDLRVPNGEARLRDVRGAVKARVGSGALRLHEVEASVDARVESGAIQALLQPAAGTAVALATGQGDVLIQVRHDASLDVSLEARDGQCHFVPPFDGVRADTRWTRLQMGDAAASLQVKTGQGSIVFERMGTEPVSPFSLDAVH